MSEIREYHDKEWLQHQYTIELKSLGEIATMCNVSKNAIWRWMKRLGVKRRTGKEATNLNSLGDCKYCPRCECIHLKTYFFKHSERYDGLTPHCKSCMVEINAEKGRSLLNEISRKNRRLHRKEYNKYMSSYRKTTLGKENMKRGIAKRKKNLRWIPLMKNIYPEEIPVHWHHINNFFTIPIPEKTHNHFNLGASVKEHRELCNGWIMNNLLNLNILEMK